MSRAGEVTGVNRPAVTHELVTDGHALIESARFEARSVPIMDPRRMSILLIPHQAVSLHL